MVTKHKLSFIIIFLFILFIAGCDLFNDYKKPKEPRIEYTSRWLYNEDGTRFTGNGKIVFYYTGSDGNTVEIFYANVTNGEYGREKHTYYPSKYPSPPDITYIDPPPYVDYRLLSDNEPFFIYKPQDYNDSNITINISNLTDNVNNTDPKKFFERYKFYNGDTPGEYKPLVNMREKRDENGYVTERLFRNTFASYHPIEGPHYINGKLTYTQILIDSIKNKTEEADVTITYDLNIFPYMPPENMAIHFIHTIYTHAVYTIIEEETDYIHYKVDVIVFEDGDKNYNIIEDWKESWKGDWNFYDGRFTLIDQNFRMRPSG